MRVQSIAMAAGLSACLLGASAAASAATSTPKAGKIRVFISNQTDTRGKILITGAIADYGRIVSEDANGKVDPNGDFEKVTLKQGGFLVDGTALNKKLNSSPPTINKVNCSLSFTGSGSTTVEDGTGAYAGISGKVVITVTYAGIAKKTVKGCNLSNNAPVFGQYDSTTGVGHVRFAQP